MQGNTTRGRAAAQDGRGQMGRERLRAVDDAPELSRFAQLALEAVAEEFCTRPAIVTGGGRTTVQVSARRAYYALRAMAGAKPSQVAAELGQDTATVTYAVRLALGAITEQRTYDDRCFLRSLWMSAVRWVEACAAEGVRAPTFSPLTVPAPRAQRRWTEKEVRHLHHMLAQGWSKANIARALGRSHQSVTGRMDRDGLTYDRRAAA